MLKKRWVRDKSMVSEQEHHACNRFPIFSEARQFPCKIVQIWICNMLNSGYHLPGTAAGQQQKTRWRYMKRPGQHRHSLVLLRHRGRTAKGPQPTLACSPISSIFNHFTNLADKIVTFSTSRDKVAAACAFSLEACHSASVSAHTLAAYFHLWDCIYERKLQ